MKLSDPGLLSSYMARADMTGAHLGRKVHRSRQFISQLIKGNKASCTKPVADGIERALGVPPGTLFSPDQDIGPPIDNRADSRVA